MLGSQNSSFPACHFEADIIQSGNSRHVTDDQQLISSQGSVYRYIIVIVVYLAGSVCFYRMSKNKYGIYFNGIFCFRLIRCVMFEWILSSYGHSHFSLNMRKHSVFSSVHQTCTCTDVPILHMQQIYYRTCGEKFVNVFGDLIGSLKWTLSIVMHFQS